MVSLVTLALNDKRTINIDTSRNVKPDKPKGHLVNTPIYKVPFEYFGDLAKDTYGIVKGFKGKANDYELGKQNDVALKLGIFSIAAYLMTFQNRRIDKLMELVGASVFLASMALWPKLAISLPIKLRTGVDTQQKYVDSYGRKKNFFQDPQYLPWDLYSKEQIDKMGRKMGVPLDVPNRDEVIKEKARKLAVQGNTLWMATAGFATPIMTGLACFGLKPYVDRAKLKYDLIKSQIVMNSQKPYTSTTAAPQKIQKALETYLNKNMGSKIYVNAELINLFDWADYRAALMPEKLGEDLTKILEKNNGILNEETANHLRKVHNALSSYYMGEDALVNWGDARFTKHEDSFASQSWNRVTRKIISAMGFNSKEVEHLSYEGPRSRRLLAQRMEEIAADPKRYKKVITKIGEQIAKYDSEINESLRQQYYGYVDDLSLSAYEKLKNLGFDSTAEYVGGKKIVRDASGNIIKEVESLPGSMRNYRKIKFDEYVMERKASNYRFLQSLDLHRRIKTGTFADEFDEIVKNMGNHTPNFSVVEDLAKNTMLEGEVGTHVNKLGVRPTAYNTYKTTIRLTQGALPDDLVKDSIFNMCSNVEKSLPIIKKINDNRPVAEVYEAAVKAGLNETKLNIYRTGMSQDTIEALYGASKKVSKKTGKVVNLIDSIKKYTQTFIKHVVNVDNPRIPGLMLTEHDVTGAVKDLKGDVLTSLVGNTPKEMLTETATQMYNSTKWLKIFGPLGAVLLTGTVLTTLFFGRLPLKEMYMKDGNKK